MNAKPKTLDVVIMGRTYKVACEDDQKEALLASVGYLDQKMCEIKSTGKVASVERIAIMAALNIAHELLSSRTGGSAVSAFDMESLRRRMVSMQMTLDEALASSELPL